MTITDSTPITSNLGGFVTACEDCARKAAELAESAGSADFIVLSGRVRDEARDDGLDDTKHLVVLRHSLHGNSSADGWAVLLDFLEKFLEDDPAYGAEIPCLVEDFDVRIDGDLLLVEERREGGVTYEWTVDRY